MICFLTSVLLAALAVALLRRSRLATSALDRPNHRSLHEEPTPRIGGIAIAISVLATLLVLQPAAAGSVSMALAGALAVISLLDDRSNLPVAWRLAAQAIAAAGLTLVLRASLSDIAGTRDAGFNVLLENNGGVVLVVVMICWMTNLFNFMDGADGLAGGMAFIGFGAYALASIAADQSPSHSHSLLQSPAIALSGAALGFLFFNFPPAKVFMGDAGAIPIGFLAAAVGIEGNLSGTWPWWFGPLVFSPFIVDATVTLLKRLVRGEKVWVAHREHYYQRLILGGWSHRKTVISYYVLMLGSALSALAAQKGNHLFPIASFWVITYTSLLLYLEWRFYQQKKHKTEKNSEAI